MKIFATILLLSSHILYLVGFYTAELTHLNGITSIYIVVTEYGDFNSWSLNNLFAQCNYAVIPFVISMVLCVQCFWNARNIRLCYDKPPNDHLLDNAVLLFTALMFYTFACYLVYHSLL